MPASGKDDDNPQRFLRASFACGRGPLGGPIWYRMVFVAMAGRKTQRSGLWGWPRAVSIICTVPWTFCSVVVGVGGLPKTWRADKATSLSAFFASGKQIIHRNLVAKVAGPRFLEYVWKILGLYLDRNPSFQKII